MTQQHQNGDLPVTIAQTLGGGGGGSTALFSSHVRGRAKTTALFSSPSSQRSPLLHRPLAIHRPQPVTSPGRVKALGTGVYDPGHFSTRHAPFDFRPPPRHRPVPSRSGRRSTHSDRSPTLPRCRRRRRPASFASDALRIRTQPAAGRHCGATAHRYGSFSPVELSYSVTTATAPFTHTHTPVIGVIPVPRPTATTGGGAGLFTVRDVRRTGRLSTPAVVARQRDRTVKIALRYGAPGGSTVRSPAGRVIGQAAEWCGVPESWNWRCYG